MFAETAVPVVPEGMLDAIIDKANRLSIRDAKNREEESPMAGWWTLAAPGMRVAYALVLIVMAAGGIYMGHDLWKNTAPANVTANYDNDYPGISAFVTMQPGSIEQTYFDLTSYGTRRSGK